MKRHFIILLAILCILSLTACGQSAASVSGASDIEKDNNTDTTSNGIGIHHVEISVKDYGIISVELNGDMAPISTENFLNLASEGFYDGLTFHRIIEGFMMQGGDPTGTGSGGSEQNIKGEFIANGVNNTLSHTRGAISMARSKKNDSASSQFFIVQEDSTYLDGSYACFGYVTDGMDVVDEICKNAVTVGDNGMVMPENQPVIEYIKVIE